MMRSTNAATHKSIAVINPPASAKYLYEELKRQRVNCYAIYTRPLYDIYQSIKINHELFAALMYFDEHDVDGMVQVLAALNVALVINGNDLSNQLTDKIAERITPAYANDSATANFRVDKFLMQKRLQQNGLPSIQTIKIDLDQDEIASVPKQWPLFCKPAISVGSVGAFHAKSDEEFNLKHSRLHRDYLLQEPIDGEEYFVDMFSIAGQHFVSSVQRYRKDKIHGIPVPRFNECVNQPTIFDDCANYVKQCLDACGLRNGFSHTEIFKTSDGFKLVEINPRMSGAAGIPNKVATYAGLPSQPELLSQFLHKGLDSLYTINQKPIRYSRMLSLHRYQDGILKDPRPLLNRFSSVKEVHFLFTPGTRTSKGYFGALTTACFVLLANDSQQNIEEDTRCILELEEKGVLFGDEHASVC